MPRLARRLRRGKFSRIPPTFFSDFVVNSRSKLGDSMGRLRGRFPGWQIGSIGR